MSKDEIIRRFVDGSEKVEFVNRERSEPESLVDRANALEAIAAERLTGRRIDGFAEIVCDGCGKSVELALPITEEPEGWALDTDRGDLCPGCAT